MMTQVVCGKCGKRYQVNAEFAGRRAQCKACGEVMQVPKTEAKAGAEPGGQSHDYDLAATNPGACASRAEKRSGPAATAVSATQVKPAAAPARSQFLMPQKSPERDRRGVRINADFQQPFLAWMEPKALIAGKIIFWTWAAIFLLTSVLMAVSVIQLANLFGATVPLGQLAVVLLGLPVVLCLWVAVQLPAAGLGAQWVGKKMKFDLPEALWWRILSSQALAVGYGAVGWMVAFAVHLAGGAGLIGSAVKALGVVPAIALFTLPLSLPTHFFATWLLLRLRFVETLAIWAFEMVLTAAFVGITVAAGYVLLR